MKTDIILSGVGGQGILSIAAIIGQAALSEGLHIKQAEVHGMSQRGGDVQSNLRISSQPIHSDLIEKGRADVIISLEPMEALRYIPYLSPKGWVVANVTPFDNISNYPDKDEIIKELSAMENVILIDADAIAAQTGGPRGVNVVLLGAAAAILEIESSKLEQAIRKLFARKGESVVESNLRSYHAGLEQGVKQFFFV